MENYINDPQHHIEYTDDFCVDESYDFCLENYPYLFKVPKIRHPPGIEVVGPLVYKESDKE
jgi:hypothetical protein